MSSKIIENKMPLNLLNNKMSAKKLANSFDINALNETIEINLNKLYSKSKITLEQINIVKSNINHSLLKKQRDFKVGKIFGVSEYFSWSILTLLKIKILVNLFLNK
ncbi:hypothetical protein RRG50_04595 [Mycoplasmopsis felis]|uniref:hypothetical protein n=1 Tax=Mycoplasmopsis felis TaxID=33923 RepID=UPI002AFF6980|nr:hypothetical protein [Mycoplasmopsis felis]WQQ11201.1 hypothetical protein RRG45_01690 [Mycoplasmopsis felis]